MKKIILIIITLFSLSCYPLLATGQSSGDSVEIRITVLAEDERVAMISNEDGEPEMLFILPDQDDDDEEKEVIIDGEKVKLY